MNELKCVGRGAHIFKIDISHAFRHLKIDPADLDLLGPYWDAYYVDMCLPFQCVSDAVRYIMHRHGHRILIYVDDFLGVGMPRDMHCILYSALEQLGLTISAKKLVTPGTRAVCLGIMFDTVTGEISIPDEKMMQIVTNVDAWVSKTHCTRRQLQSLLGHLLYFQKCVKPSRYFVNRMWLGRRLLVKCDNDPIVKALSHGCARDPFLAACARNVWYILADSDINASFVHVMVKKNQVAELFSPWAGYPEDYSKLSAYLLTPYGYQSIYKC